MAVKQGDKVTITAEVEDESEAIAALERLFSETL
jgi:phosphotransferase system HPr-like phosphotransfer protein